MEYVQKKGKHEIKIQFETSGIKYFIKDAKSKGEFTIPNEFNELKSQLFKPEKKVIN
jgi:hypothetical protein